MVLQYHGRARADCSIQFAFPLLHPEKLHQLLAVAQAFSSRHAPLASGGEEDGLFCIVEPSVPLMQPLGPTYRQGNNIKVLGNYISDEGIRDNLNPSGARHLKLVLDGRDAHVRPRSPENIDDGHGFPLLGSVSDWNQGPFGSHRGEFSGSGSYVQAKSTG